ncbi:MAG: pyridoxamine 5'-phosphate oxidase family protein, partial [Caldisphaera sp.]
MLYSNDDNYIYLHGSPESRIVNVLKVNGIVLAEMVKDNSVNY